MITPMVIRRAFETLKREAAVRYLYERGLAPYIRIREPVPPQHRLYQEEPRASGGVSGAVDSGRAPFH